MSKIIGLIGGLSWASSAHYYRIINEKTNAGLGGINTATSILYNVNLPEYLDLAKAGRNDELGAKFVAVAKTLEQAGAGVLLICSNTMHIAAPYVEGAVNIPLIHIADGVGAACKKAGFKKVGLIGTPVTMAGTFISGRLKERFDIDTVVPHERYWPKIFDIIEQELTFDVAKDESRQYYLEAIEDMRAQGAEAVILGCTEIMILIKQQHTSLPIFDTTEYHAQAAVDWFFSK